MRKGTKIENGTSQQVFELLADGKARSVKDLTDAIEGAGKNRCADTDVDGSSWHTTYARVAACVQYFKNAGKITVASPPGAGSTNRRSPATYTLAKDAT